MRFERGGEAWFGWGMRRAVAVLLLRPARGPAEGGPRKRGRGEKAVGGEVRGRAAVGAEPAPVVESRPVPTVKLAVATPEKKAPAPAPAPSASTAAQKQPAPAPEKG